MNSGESALGGSGLQSSRLLGRTELTDTAPSEIRSYLQRLAQPQVAKSSLFIIGLQGGPGPRQVPVERRGAMNPTWRDAYVHLISSGADVDLETNTPGRALRKAADWAEVNQEQVYREWAPEKGSYMNEANPYTTEWQHDFYGESYDRLAQIKKRYDPTESLYVLAGVGTEAWDYDMDTGYLCKTVSSSS